MYQIIYSCEFGKTSIFIKENNRILAYSNPGAVENEKDDRIFFINELDNCMKLFKNFIIN